MFNIMYGPVYSPMLNPIELLFGTWKHYVRKLKTRGRTSSLQSIVKSSHMITLNQLRNFTKHDNRFRLISFLGEKI